MSACDFTVAGFAQQVRAAIKQREDGHVSQGEHRPTG